MKKIINIIATFLYIGKAKKAPGTFGSLATIPFWTAFINYFDLNKDIIILIIANISIAVIAIIVSDLYVKIHKKEDPCEVVIDEVAGQFLALSVASMLFYKLGDLYAIERSSNIILMTLSFALFRYFDIKKPSIVGYLDKNIHGGLGIVVDDLCAGLIAGIITGITMLIL